MAIIHFRWLVGDRKALFQKVEERLDLPRPKVELLMVLLHDWYCQGTKKEENRVYLLQGSIAASNCGIH